MKVFELKLMANMHDMFKFLQNNSHHNQRYITFYFSTDLLAHPV